MASDFEHDPNGIQFIYALLTETKRQSAGKGHILEIFRDKTDRTRIGLWFVFMYGECGKREPSLMSFMVLD